MSSSEATVDQDDARSDFLAQSMRSERDGSQRPRLHTLDTDNLAYHTSTAGGSNPTETIFAQLQIIKELQVITRENPKKSEDWAALTVSMDRVKSLPSMPSSRV